jgi:hypothetical protein
MENLAPLILAVLAGILTFVGLIKGLGKRCLP